MPEDPKPDDKPKDDKTFTQADVDRIVADRLKRERDSKFADYDELKAKAAKLDDLEQSKKTSEQKLTERIEAAERKAQEAEQRVAQAEAGALRATVASEKGLTAAQAKRLAGSTREELEADADDLLTSFKPAEGNGNTTPGKPTESLKGGGDPDGSNEPAPDMRKIVADIPRGF